MNCRVLHDQPPVPVKEYDLTSPPELESAWGAATDGASRESREKIEFLRSHAERTSLIAQSALTMQFIRTTEAAKAVSKSHTQFVLTFRNHFLTGDIPTPEAWLKLNGSLIHTDGAQAFSDNPWDIVYKLGLRETQVGYFQYSKKLKTIFAKLKAQFLHPHFFTHLCETTVAFLETLQTTLMDVAVDYSGWRPSYRNPKRSVFQCQSSAFSHR